MSKDINKFLQLFVTFSKIGCFTIGGGYAMIPMIQHETVNKKSWLSNEESIDFITIAQSAPGVISINMASATGYKVAGFFGSLIATAGICLPSILIIIIIATFFDSFLSIGLVQKAFMGIRAAVIAIMLYSALNMFKTSVRTSPQIILFIAAIALSFFNILPTQLIILISAIFGILINTIEARRWK